MTHPCSEGIDKDLSNWERTMALRMGTALITYSWASNKSCQDALKKIRDEVGRTGGARVLDNLLIQEATKPSEANHLGAKMIMYSRIGSESVIKLMKMGMNPLCLARTQEGMPEKSAALEIVTTLVLERGGETGYEILKELAKIDEMVVKTMTVSHLLKKAENISEWEGMTKTDLRIDEMVTPLFGFLSKMKWETEETKVLKKRMESKKEREEALKKEEERSALSDLEISRKIILTDLARNGDMDLFIMVGRHEGLFEKLANNKTSTGKMQISGLFGADSSSRFLHDLLSNAKSGEAFLFMMREFDDDIWTMIGSENLGEPLNVLARLNSKLNLNGTGNRKIDVGDFLVACEKGAPAGWSAEKDVRRYLEGLEKGEGGFGDEQFKSELESWLMGLSTAQGVSRPRTRKI